ncbi:discoidin domain-containing protein [Bifidobacterium sp. TKU]|nr:MULTISPECIES: discoidin domain-containing protein [Bifidobacterium]MDB1305245.1 discoidin domain-containing protein [Bifidobacterium bifidum]MDG5950904.1 discoidin domain-containing protein [Bifidobacterium bifidum]MDG5958351.1 discoidin domain-containing protein [Bifidobacterium bifidum]MDX8333905.1 discoidin domain-containing protein [Bifidobacterium bifidum]MDZ5630755.1 discoidin domain-containing protein [Bifidobacterium bifidum]
MLTNSAWAVEDATRSDSTTQMSSTPEVVYSSAVDSKQNRTSDFDANWKFMLSDSVQAQDPAFDDSAWQQVDLPHDYSITQKYSQSNEAESAYLPGGTGWYRKSFTIDRDLAGKRIAINFDGVYMNATVWFNGVKLGTHPYGYSPFSFDLTGNAKFGGENTIVVKVENRLPSSRWYSGSGIYRDVTLTVTDGVHVGNNGVAIKTPSLATQNGGNVTMNLTTKVANDTEAAANITLKQTVFPKGGKTDAAIGTVTTASKSIAAGASADVTSTITAASPKLWSIKNPNLYTVRTEVLNGDTVLDTYDTEYGFRWTGFDATSGFSLNGEKVKLKGVSMHHDQGSLGAVANRRAIERQVEILQKMGVNSIRTTHNPAAKALIDVCNEKGVLVVEEVFDMWNRSKNGNTEDYGKWFGQTIAGDNAVLGGDKDETWAKFDLTSTINRDRNAPSVIMWSLGNEMMEGISGSVSDFPATSAKLVAWTKAADSTRPMTYGDNKIKANWNESNTMGDNLTANGGVVGTNYSDGANYDKIRTTHPSWAIYGSETASAINSRGIYNRTTGGAQSSDKQLTSYDNSAVGWGAVASSAWYDVVQRDFVAGTYVWTGFDYLGEPTPWNGTGSGAVGSWPSPKNSYFGIVDTAGFPKDTYYFYQSQWNDDVHTLHILPAWNENVVAKGSGNKVPVVVYTDAAKVKLYFTPKGSTEKRLIGEKSFTKKTTAAGYTYQVYEGTDKDSTAHKNMYLTWNVPWAEGTISAEAYDENNRLIPEGSTEGNASVTTTGKAAKLKADADRKTITADGKDLSYIEVDVTDANGHIVPDAANRVTFDVKGAGKLVGVDNGSSPDHDSYQADNRKAFSGKVLAIVQSTKEAGEITVTAKADGLQSSTVKIATTAVPGTSTEKTVRSFYYSRNYYVKTGNKPILPSDVEVRYSDGTSDRQNVTWDAVSDDQIAKAGSFSVAGTVAGQKISVRVTMIDEIGALLNYSASTPVGTPAVLPGSRPAVLPDGTVTSANFAVHWTKPADTVYNTAGTVKVPGTATVFGKEFKVTATIRVQRSQVTIGSSVSGNALRLTQNIPADKQSDTLDAIKDGSTTVDANTGGGANPSAWTNWAYSKAGHNTAEITFEYATEQQLGQIVMYFFRDSNAVRFPDAGKTKIQISADGKNWTDLAATETIAAQESSDRVKPYTYDFAPVGATFVKVTVTNADTTTPSGVVCAGLTEIELKTATSKFVTNTSAALSSLTVNGTKVSDSVLAAGSYNTPAIIADVKAEGEGNASVTVLPAHDNVIRVITESEDHVTRKTFTINLGTEQEFPADSDERDYPAADMTVTAGSEQTSGTATEGPKKFAVDGNTSTYWHSNWTPTTVNDLWIAFELQKPTKLDALRYLPRPAGSKNGSVTEYKVQVSDDGTNWTDAGSGTWTTDYGWKLAEFNQPVTTKHVRLKAVHTYADSGNDKFMSASEIRLRKAFDTTDISGATVTVPAKLTVDRVDTDHPATFATKDVTVTLGDATLRYGVDYLLDYAGNTAVGKATVTVRGIDKYSGTVAKTFTIELKNAPAPEPTLTSVSVKTKPSKLTYVVDDKFDPAGLVLQLNYDDDSTGTVTWNTQTAGDFTFKPALDAKLKVTDKTVTVTYQGKSAVIDITVSQPAPTVSKTDLDKAIKAIEAKNPDSSKYTADSWKTFADAMAHAKAVIADDSATQQDVDNALKALTDAYAGLTEKTPEPAPVSKSELDKKIKAIEAEKLDGSKYTAESWKAFETALAHAKAVIASDSATQQDVDAALGALTSARDGLTEKGEVKPDPKPEPGTVDKTALDKAVKKVEAEKLDGSKYTAESWKAFETALAHAKAVIGNANSTQFDIDNALSMLNDARAALKEKPGRIIAIIDGSALSKTGASVAIIASVAAAMLAVGAGVMALRRKRS